MATWTKLQSRSIRIEWDNCSGGRFTIRCKEGGYSRAIKFVRERNVEIGEIEDCNNIAKSGLLHGNRG
jgi:hypothetical protein